jgi:hypothetical protein
LLTVVGNLPFGNLGLVALVGQLPPVIFSKPCKHERQVSGLSTFDRFGGEFVFSLISTINTFFGLAKL